MSCVCFGHKLTKRSHLCYEFAIPAIEKCNVTVNLAVTQLITLISSSK